ncbi:bifunctional nuclease family protein [Desulfonatronum thioautotrophicum]|uniref:bifunctional nuclease family protein n=1 Tax=Desulfonatronum thioautotrophicum TaxID=617001 RepID=UPI0005EB56BC|nr:bifunctional nuclease family protein [Desulfonatronum thioautotrophicum]
MIEMHIYGLALDEDSQVPVLILKDKEEKQVLPIWIGAMEAVAISMVLNDVRLPRPMTHDLLLQAIEALGGEVRNVDVVRLQDNTYFAEIVVLQGEALKRIDSRPSDAIALGLRAQVPIRVSEEVLAHIVEVREKRYQAVLKTEDAQQWNEILEKYTIDDTKYKM